MQSSYTPTFFPPSADYVKWIGHYSAEWKIALYFNYAEDDSLKSIKLTEIIDKYIPPTTDKYQAFDTTCHIMMDLTGDEANGLFTDQKQLERLAKEAVLEACKEAGVSRIEDLNEETQFTIGGLALWILLLPKSAGGVCPDSEYDSFIENIAKGLQVFKPEIGSSIVKISPSLLKDSFIGFKTLTLEQFKLQNNVQPYSELDY